MVIRKNYDHELMHVTDLKEVVHLMLETSQPLPTAARQIADPTPSGKLDPIQLETHPKTHFRQRLEAWGPT